METDSKPLDVLVKQLAESFTQSYYPEEAPYFSLVWQRVVDQVAGKSFDGSDPRGIAVASIGLPFADEKRIRLTAPYTILTIASVFYELRESGLTPSQDQVSEAIRSGARALGASQSHADKLVAHLVPQLLSLFERGNLDAVFAAEYSAADIDAHSKQLERGDVDPAIVYVAKPNPELVCVDTARCPREEASAVANSDQYEVLVDEVFHHRVRVRDEEPRGIHDLTETQRGMLWLVLTCAGGYLDHQDIRDLWSLPEPAIVHHYRTRFVPMLGELAEVIMPESRKGRMKGWRIPLDGWSFCWLRKAREERTSELLKGIVQ